MPGERGYPVLGSMARYLIDGPLFQRRLHATYGPVAWWGGAGIRAVSVAGPEPVWSVLVNAERAYVSGWDLIGPWFAGGLARLDGHAHIRHRRLVRDAFTAEAEAGYCSVMADRAADAVAAWPTGRSVPVQPLVTELSASLTVELFLGPAAVDDAARIVAAIDACERAILTAVRIPAPGTPWQRGLNARKWLRRYILARVDAAPAGSVFGHVARATDAEGVGLTPDEVADHVVLTMLASHDTTAFGLLATLYHLGRHPRWQDAVRDETRLRGTTTVGPAVDAEAPVLMQVVRESLRLYPPSPTQLRRTATEVELADRHIPSGTLVTVCNGLNGLLPEYWEAADEFRPERFAPGGGAPLDVRGAWVPFGGGAHKCIGMDLALEKIATLAATVVDRYRWQLPDDYRMAWKYAFPGGPADGLPLTLRPLRPGTR